jgi:hypothetical protein
MKNNQLRKLMELLGEASNEINPTFVRGEEIEDFWDLNSVGELYRYLEGLAQ